MTHGVNLPLTVPTDEAFDGKVTVHNHRHEIMTFTITQGGKIGFHLLLNFGHLFFGEVSIHD
jgi:hypothetical protein